MNVLLVCKLGDSTLTENVLRPMLASGRVGKIYVLRDYKGTLVDDRVEYVVPAKPQKGTLRHVAKIWRGIRAVRRKRVNTVVGVLNTPHGFIGRVIGLLSRRPYVHMTIAGHREFWVDGPRMEKLNLRLFGSGAAITVTGERTRQYLLGKGVRPEMIFIMPNLPDEAFTKVPLREERRYDIVSFSRIDRNKNLILLIRALAALKDQYPLKVAVAGDGDEMENIVTAAKTSGVADKIDFLGYISGVEEKIRVLSDSRIFISCSKGEGFPVALLEAMNCGCVPVVSDVGDISDVIVNGENGYMYEDTDDEAEFVSCLKELLSEPERVKAMRKEAAKIKESISVARNGERWDKIFQYVSDRYGC